MKSFMLSLGLLIVLITGVFLLLPPAPNAAAKTDFQDGNVRMTVLSNEKIAERMKMSTFTLTLTDLEGNPIEKADLKVILQMPNMLCGNIPTDIVESKPGTYLISGIPVMQGSWEAQVSLRLPDKLIHLNHPFTTH
ncbi:FixH family protein [Cohnella mopanensis]|uniref:FixH family protein n=1 Tax=Cohnella mopanensis TaxID=2911966 RepID=UPI001EF7D567|nr:FixH family protein [Cohnella mopanensis]